MGWGAVFLVRRERKRINEDYVEKKPKKCSNSMLHNFSPDHDTMESLYKSKCEWCGVSFEKVVMEGIETKKRTEKAAQVNGE